MTRHPEKPVRILGLVTARGGSKGIPGKNIAGLGGKPLIAWTIEAALNAQLIDRVIVSTDSEDIAVVARHCGAEVPFMRPAELAGDNSPHIDTLVHALNVLQGQQDYRPDYVMLLQPTSPFRTDADIDGAARVAIEKDAAAVLSVCQAPVHPFFMKTIRDSNGTLADLSEKPAGYLPRQALQEAYALNGAIYLVKSSIILAGNTWSDVEALPYIMPESRSMDIDTPWDLHLANLLMENRFED
jgi:CMP-N,N'-diacetyllegionaminic acid synthase